jgi:hypothetical protein
MVNTGMVEIPLIHQFSPMLGFSLCTQPNCTQPNRCQKGIDLRVLKEFWYRLVDRISNYERNGL